MSDSKTSDAISRSAALTVGNIRKVTEYDEAGYDMTYDAVPVEAIEALPDLDVAPVVHGEFARLPEEVIPCLHVDPVLCKTCNTTFFTFNKEGKRLMLCPYCGARYSGATNGR